MELEQALAVQLQAHPAMQPQDVIKLCYQAARGAEHLLADPDAAARWLRQEYEAVPADKAIPLAEEIGPESCRVNLAGWKAHGLPVEWLFGIFCASAAQQQGGEATLEDYLTRAGQVLAAERPALLPQWQEELAVYRHAGMPAVHHSEAYREQEKPAYRIVHRRWLRLVPVLQALCALPAAPQRPVVIAIDGRAGSGKSTMAQQLAQLLDAAVVQMDDFFLPTELRTPQRFAQPGGNVHYERFAAEVLPHLARPRPFAYRRFACGEVMDYDGERQVPAKPYRIVEGTYSHHPALGRYADLTVFSQVEAEEQLRRIEVRNGPELAQLFRTRWIPLEEAYFAACRTEQNADLRV